MKTLTGCLTGLLMATPAAAQYVDGNTLHGWCQSSKASAETYAMGAYDAFWLNDLMGQDAPLRVCVASNVNSVQIRDVVCNHLQDHPETRHLAASTLVWSAVNEAWPCQ